MTRKRSEAPSVIYYAAAGQAPPAPVQAPQVQPQSAYQPQPQPAMPQQSWPMPFMGQAPFAPQGGFVAIQQPEAPRTRPKKTDGKPRVSSFASWEQKQIEALAAGIPIVAPDGKRLLRLPELSAALAAAHTRKEMEAEFASRKAGADKPEK